ncbi:hypothetical protein AB0K60_21675 [Thermopolyspora sp. NPDC052614]|uniref:hypothetical protein n=1 Tax=Thermopolyspora sp. NPDC052614 TaxID=3155682 RepID=UPI003418D241
MSGRYAAGRLCEELAAWGVVGVVLESGPVVAVSAGEVLVWVERGPGGGWGWVWATGRVNPATGRRVRTWCAWPNAGAAARRVAERSREAVICRERGEGDGAGGWGLAMRDVPLRHGFALGDVERLAWVAARRSRWSDQTLFVHDRYLVALSAIAEELFARPGVPEARVLVDCGVRAISRHVFAERRERGVSDRPDRGRRVREGAWAAMPRFEAFWYTAASPVVAHEERVVEVVALGQVWARLSGRNREVLAALAEHGTYEGAAAALGVSRVSVSTLVYHARKQFLRLWHEGEEPSRLWGRGVPRNPELRRYTSSGAWALGTLRRRDRKRLKRRRREGEAR